MLPPIVDCFQCGRIPRTLKTSVVWTRQNRVARVFSSSFIVTCEEKRMRCPQLTLPFLWLLPFSIASFLNVLSCYSSPVRCKRMPALAEKEIEREYFSLFGFLIQRANFERTQKKQQKNDRNSMCVLFTERSTAPVESMS